METRKTRRVHLLLQGLMMLLEITTNKIKKETMTQDEVTFEIHWKIIIIFADNKTSLHMKEVLWATPTDSKVPPGHFDGNSSRVFRL